MADTLDTAPPGRRRRSDARRSIDAILNAARTVLGERPDASMEDIAAAAGVTRQTVYAHFPSRDALIAALLHAAGAETVAAIDAARLDTVPPADALRQFLDIGWQLIRGNPFLLGPALTRNRARQQRPPPRRYRPARTDHPARPARRRLRPHAPRRLARRRHRRARSHRRRSKSPPDASPPARRPPWPWTARCDCAAPAPAVRRERLRQRLPQPEHPKNVRRRPLRTSGLRDAVAQVRHGPRDGFPLRDQLGPLPGEQRRALPQQQRNEVDAHLVEQARPEQLPGDVRT